MFNAESVSQGSAACSINVTFDLTLIQLVALLDVAWDLIESIMDFNRTNRSLHDNSFFPLIFSVCCVSQDENKNPGAVPY